jgi:phosphate starvation-inducible PhoH-like protein
VLEDIDPVVFYGVNNSHLQLVKSFYPKLRIVARDNVLKVLGDEEELQKFAESIDALCKHVSTFNSLREEDIVNIINGRKPQTETSKDVLVYSTSGRAIRARSAHQQDLINSFSTNDMVFAIGPAGTGKTYLGIALAVKALKEKTARKIILCRPAVEAGEKLGFLPGDMRDKIDPYLQPLYDALEDMLPTAKLQDMMEKNVIQIAPLAFMRGRTLNDAIVILDEAQNTTTAQIRMFLTRMGWNTKMIITGDLTQIDLPRGNQSGLREAFRLLRGIEGIGFIEMDESDIVRHKLVTRIVKAYERDDREKEQKRNENNTNTIQQR